MKIISKPSDLEDFGDPANTALQILLGDPPLQAKVSYWKEGRISDSTSPDCLTNIDS